MRLYDAIETVFLIAVGVVIGDGVAHFIFKVAI